MIGKIEGTHLFMLYRIQQSRITSRYGVGEDVFLVFSDDHALTDNRFDGEGPGLVDKEDVGIFTGGNGADAVVDFISFGSIDGGHLDGRHRSETGSKLVWRAMPGAPPVMARTFSLRNLVTADSRMMVCIPLRAFSKNS